MSPTKPAVLTEEQIKARLTGALRHWTIRDGWLVRTYRTHGWKGTVMVIGAIGHLAEAAWHHPDISASYAWVEVRLITHSAKGLTEMDLALANKIEEVVHWRPSAEGGALTGTPVDDQRFAYIRYDD